MTESFNHPNLGKLRPKSIGNVNQFLGLKYASLKDRFAAPKLYSPSSTSIIDATQHGPSVICLSIGCVMEFGLIQKELAPPPFSQSELDGLNLTVTVPVETTPGKKLPVLVFIHGGGFFIGGNSWPQYDLAKFVELSIELGEPIIGIGINYRLGIFGNLTSEDLTSQGYSGNNALKDQQTAFEWIRANISGFGGDPDNITVSGESAGGVSTTLHLYSPEPQFARAISFGGTGLLLKPLPPFVHEMTYKTVLGNLGISELSPEDRVKALLTMPIDDILSKVPPGLPLFPVIDGTTITGAPTFTDISSKNSSLPGKKWCKGLLIGDNELDASILSMGIEGASPETVVQRFIDSITRNLAAHPGVADTILKTYGISTSLPREEGLIAVLNFATDIGFAAPTQAYAKGWPGDAYVYCFNEPNPWGGRWKGYASHVLDVAFVFQNFSEHLSDAQKESSRRFAADVIRFVNGKAPWTAYDEKAPSVRVYGPSIDKNAVAEASLNDKKVARRRADIFEIAEKPGLDALSDAWGMFVAGR